MDCSKLVAVTTGVISMLLAIGYLVLAQILGFCLGLLAKPYLPSCLPCMEFRG